MTAIDLHTFEPITPPTRSVLCLGNFDGVHLGHRALVSEALTQKAQLLTKYTDIKCGVWFFGRAPHDIISNQSTPKLTDLDQKLEIFSELGLDVAFIYEYEEVGHLSPEDFVRDILRKECGCIYAVCGYNFKFGKNAVGDATLLTHLMDDNATVVDRIELGKKNVCSSEIRSLISEGQIEEANLLLGRRYSIHGTVVQGKQLGRKLGIPTINQSLIGNVAIPKNGIYVTRTLIDGRWLPSVSNVGVRPSVENGANVNCETYILEFDGNLYGQNIRVEFIKRLRDEIKFESIELLTKQINKDIEEAKKFFETEA